MVEVYFEKLYKAHYRDVFRYAVKRTKNEELAEDITQETFIEAYKSIETVKECTYPRAWLITVARRIIYHQYQRLENQQTLVPLYEIADDLQDTDAEVCVQESFKENLCRILQKHDADLIVLLYEEGYSISEAAVKLGISLSACKMRLLRAREKIRKSDLAKEAGYMDFSGDETGKRMEKPGKGDRTI